MPRNNLQPAAGDALDAYLRDIGGIPLLKREQEVLLAKEVEAATHAFRSGMCEIPWLAQQALEEWRRLKAQGRASSKMREHMIMGPGAAKRMQACKSTVDLVLAKLEAQVAKRKAALAAKDSAARRRIQKRMAKLLMEAELSMQLLARWYQQLRGWHAETPRAQRRRLERRLGVPAAAFAARMQTLEDAWQRLSQAKNVFVQHNLKLVCAVAKDFRHLGIAYPDLIQEGNIALVRAVEKFEYARGFKFSTYAVWWIRQALIRAVQSQGRTIRLPGHVHDMLMKYSRRAGAAEKQLGRAATRTEVAELMHLPPERAEQLQRMVREPLSMEREIAGTDSKKIKDIIADTAQASPLAGLDQARLSQAINGALEKLPRRYREVLLMRTGLQGRREHTLEEIGKKYGLSRERVRQIEMHAHRKILQDQKFREQSAQFAKLEDFLEARYEDEGENIIML